MPSMLLLPAARRRGVCAPGSLELPKSIIASGRSHRRCAAKRPRLWALLLLAAFLAFALPAFALSDREEARVEAMLAALEQSKDIVFIRNGDEHTAAEAASHLRLKLSKTRKRLDSAEQFIDKAGSASSISGRPYMVREPGKEERPANAFLHELLRQADSQ